jgi:hypothetical protein
VLLLGESIMCTMAESSSLVLEEPHTFHSSKT